MTEMNRREAMAAAAGAVLGAALPIAAPMTYKGVRGMRSSCIIGPFVNAQKLFVVTLPQAGDLPDIVSITNRSDGPVVISPLGYVVEPGVTALLVARDNLLIVEQS